MVEDRKLIPIIGIERLRMATDGTSVRTLIGTYGCPLRCKYCLNPQSWRDEYKHSSYAPELIYNQLKVDNLYFQATNGGITIVGGEPLLHIEAIAELVGLCPKEWSIWIETSLNVDSKAVSRAAELFDHFIVDIKTLDPDIYFRYTTGNGTIAYDNLKRLIKMVGAEHITVRVPEIPGYADKVSQTRFKGLNPEDTQTLIAAQKHSAAAARHEELQSQIDLAAHIEAIVHSSSCSGHANIHQIRQTRRKERLRAHITPDQGGNNS